MTDSGSNSAAAAHEGDLPLRRKLLFGGLTVLLFFGAAELLLLVLGVSPRLAAEDPFVGFAKNVPLFVEEHSADGVPTMVTAQHKLRYFNAQRFPKAKPAGAYRIFCLGGSTAYGNPYSDPTSFCGWLREFLPAADSSRRWEVINAGGISYASYREAALMEELVRYQPDLFILYSGQNEFLEKRTYPKLAELPGPLLSAGSWAARTRIYAAMEKGIAAARERLRPESAPYQLADEVDEILNHTVGPTAYTRDDELQRQVVAHFRFNLARMAAIARAGGGRMLLVTPAVNLKDISPFKSEHRAGLTAAELARWKAARERGRRAQAAGRDAAAAAAFREALEVDGRHADSWYRLGQALLATGQDEAARAAFVRASDEDICPLRALTSIQQAVREVAREVQAPVVDFIAMNEERARRELGHAIPGSEQFLDHVHPTIEMNRVLALALLEELTRAGVARPGPGWGPDTIAAVTRKVEAGIDRKAQAAALLHLGKLFDWAGKLEEAHGMLTQALALAGEDHVETLIMLAKSAERRDRDEEAVAYYRRVLAQRPDYGEARYHLAMVLDRRGKGREALEEAKQALRLAPDLADAHGLVAGLLADAGDMGAALLHGGEYLRLRPEEPMAHHNVGLLLLRSGRLQEAIVRFEQALKLKPDLADAHHGWAMALDAQAKPEDAVRHYREALRLNPNLAEAHNNLGGILARGGRLEEGARHFAEALRIDPGFAEARANLGMAREQQARAGGLRGR